METRWLEAFLAVAEELHFGRAAERLHVGQSPLSQTVRKLEKELGAELFDRSTRSVALTSAGHALLPHARQVLEELGLATSAVRSTDREVYGRLRVSFSGALNHRTVPQLTRAVREHHPQVELKFVDRLLSGEAVHRLEQGQLDLGFIGLPYRSPELESLLITVEDNHLVAPHGHPLLNRDEIEVGDLQHEPIICPPRDRGSTMRATLVSTCHAHGFTPEIAQEVLDPFMILSLVDAGLGVAIVPESMLHILPRRVSSRPMQNYPPLRSALAWNGAHRTEALNAVLALAAQVFAHPESGARQPSGSEQTG
ncbi:LysR family transcriptional regulator [Kocuria sp.]|uniref:LysR family transcriptional regulator n=1 Tax=Kocuria sp. TaxID=1871328 RepID=UPI0026E05550|nr:LysR substrate-binding domain-containing protein [Kocuria sp.]MDO5618673.1 LysR substrate-binding domain-containing protein [Kocuria sp.]